MGNLENVQNEKPDFLKDEEILKYIKKILLDRYPVIADRSEVLFNEGKRFDIHLRYVYVNGEEFTQISFLDGKGISRESIQEALTVKGKVSINLINALITYILLDHDWISSFDKSNDSVELVFKVNMREETMSGIPCETITLKLDFRKHPNAPEITDYYFKDILSVFFESLKHTSLVKRGLSSYVYNIKDVFLHNASEEEIDRFLTLLNYSSKTRVIFEMDEQSFIETYKKYQSQNSDESGPKQIS